MDFYKIITKKVKDGVFEIFSSYNTEEPTDLMIRGKAFYAVWNEETRLWSLNDSDVIRMIDSDLYLEYQKLRQIEPEAQISVKYLKTSHTGALKAFRSYITNQSDSYHQLDDTLTFQNSETQIEDYASKRLPYSINDGNCDAYTEIMSTLYDPSERRKIEWAVGAVVSGEAKNIEKFIVIYGDPGSGKGTVLKIVQRLFPGYYTMFDAKALVSSNNTFSTEVFKSNPLVAIQQDGDLSRIEDNTKLNSVVSHEEMTMNEKFKSAYISKVNCFLFMGTNSHVKITESKSGIIRRLIDVVPSGRLLPSAQFQLLNKQIDYELGAIAAHCLRVFEKLGPNFYDAYRARDMILRTNPFYNFINDNADEFTKNDGVSLMRAYTLYKEYCEDSKIDRPYQKYRFRDELKNYFDRFYEVTRPPSEDGRQVKNWYSGFKMDKFGGSDEVIYFDDDTTRTDDWLNLDASHSLLDDIFSEYPAQYANADHVPFESWDNVTKTLSDLNTTKEHFVMVPVEHIVIDFDLVDENGKKSRDLNIMAASRWKPTYAELSRSGEGLHLHYIYDGDPTLLSPNYSPGIEVKVWKGKQSLRRKVTKCNDLPISHISSGLPLMKGDKKVINTSVVQTEKGIRTSIEKNLKKEVHSSTKSSIDFIYKILEDAYNGSIIYDVSDLIPKVITFANNSTNQSDYCLKLINKMKFKSEIESEIINDNVSSSDDFVFFDVEVFPNLFIVCYKAGGEDKPVVKLINPTASQIEDLLAFRLIGFNNRRYDNHILYGAYIGNNNEQLYRLSQSLIDKENQMNGFREAHNISYTDIYDFSSASNKKSLKKWEIELGIHHQELGFPWDEPVPEDRWSLVADYCENDVVATEAVFNHLKSDWSARLILSKLSGLTPNDTTNNHTAKIILKGDKNAKSKFVYTDLSETFPGYVYDWGKSTYRGEEVGEGGYVYGEPGVYGNVAILDVQSMHPASAIAMNMFGPYTKNFEDLRNVRVYIKSKQYDKAKSLFNGDLIPFLENEEDAADLSNALKTAINSVYGLTAATFDSAFKDPRNKDNICAKRGALFMVDLKHAVQEKGYTVAHIKTDSIKIPDATPEIIEFVMEFGRQYGYIFEHEATYDRLCLLNNSTYVCRYKDGKKAGKWDSTGTQLIQPYVFKTLFSKEHIGLSDLTETKSVTTALYLDFNENLPDGEHDYRFVGKTGAFCPIVSGKGGGLLVRKKGDNYDAATGTKGFRWMEAEMVAKLGLEDIIDLQYYRNFVDQVIHDVGNFCEFDWFVSDEPYDKQHNGIYPF